MKLSAMPRIGSKSGRLIWWTCHSRRSAMLGRLVGKFILACSIALAAALMVTAISARWGDLVISAARRPTYHEVRFDRRQITLTHLWGWTFDEPPRWGRTTERLMDPAPFVGKSPGPVPPADIMLLDRIQVTLFPGKSGWWLIKRTSGNWRMPSPGIPCA